MAPAHDWHWTGRGGPQLESGQHVRSVNPTMHDLAGLLFGLIGVHPVGIAAAAGLVAFFVVAIAFHVRARVFYNLAFPAAYLAMATLSLAFAIMW